MLKRIAALLTRKSVKPTLSKAPVKDLDFFGLERPAKKKKPVLAKATTRKPAAKKVAAKKTAKKTPKKK